MRIGRIGIAVVTIPIPGSGLLKRTHGQRKALPWWWRQAGLRTLGDLLHCRFPSLFETVRWLSPCNVSFPSPLRDSAGITPASRLSRARKLYTCASPVYRKDARGSSKHPFSRYFSHIAKDGPARHRRTQYALLGVCLEPNYRGKPRLPTKDPLVSARFPTTPLFEANDRGRPPAVHRNGGSESFLPPLLQ